MGRQKGTMSPFFTVFFFSGERPLRGGEEAKHDEINISQFNSLDGVEAVTHVHGRLLLPEYIPVNFLQHQMKGDVLPPFLDLPLYLFPCLQFKAASSSSPPFLPFFSPFFCLPVPRNFAPGPPPGCLLVARPTGRSCPDPPGECRSPPKRSRNSS